MRTPTLAFIIDRYFAAPRQRCFQVCFWVCLFLGTQSLAQADCAKPILLSRTDSTRAIALESLTLMPEPFSRSASSVLYGLELRTRITVFVRNCTIESAQDLTAATGDAEDASHTHYPLRLIDVRQVSGQSWMSQATLELNEGLGDVGDVLISITYRGISSNRVRIGIGHIGGGPADDPGALPTPAPPYFIEGRITVNSVGVVGVSVMLSGPQTAVTSTDSNGAYSFSVTSIGDYTVQPSPEFLLVTPSSATFSELTGNRTANFQATTKTFTIAGQVKDETNRPLGGILVTLTGARQATATTDVNGNYSFPNLPALSTYSVAPSNTPLYEFPPQTTDSLRGDLTFTFTRARRKYTISGQITDGQNGVAGISLTLAGGDSPVPRAAVTAGDGSYAFAGVRAGYDYTLLPGSPFYILESREIKNLLSDLSQNFVGILRKFNVSGFVRDENASPLKDSIVVMSSSNGVVAMGTSCGSDGRFDFGDVPASYNYTLYPYNTATHSFTQEYIIGLAADQTKNFSGVRRFYTIGGVVKDRSNQGVAGVTVTLSGPSTSSVSTDTNGLYSFGAFAAGDDYAVNVEKTDYIFQPAARQFTLSADESADFTAIRTYRLTGRVTDANGASLAGMTINLSGAETGNVTTFTDGTYLLTVTTTGDYVLTPSSSQSFYTFSPATKSIIALNSHQTANFTGSFSAVAHPSHVLEFDGNYMTVDYGDFWPVQLGLGHFFWEFWAMPGENNHARYLVSDGYGGSHALLFGFFNSGEPGRYTLYGNTWDGATWTFFNSDDGPMQGEWGHYAVGWDGKNIITYYDGVPIGKQPFSGPRISMGRNYGASMPLIGGSDHQNLNGRIAQFRAYEQNNPRETSPESAFAPETVFSPGGQLMSYFFRPSQTVEDLSSGYNTGKHPGILRGFNQGYTINCPACPTPKFVVDPTAPDFSNPTNPGQIISPFSSAPPTPAAALFFDSFSRSNSTYLLGGKGGLATTESGSAGSQSWQTNVSSSETQPFGILNGRAVVLANDRALAWVSPAVNNLDIRVDRRLSVNGNGVNTGLCFRVVDKDNFFFVYTSDDEDNASNPKKLSIGYFQNGTRLTLASGIIMPSSSWKTLRVVARNSGSIEVYADGDLVFTTNNLTFAATSGAGLYNSGPGLGLTNRWDNFTVLSAP